MANRGVIAQAEGLPGSGDSFSELVGVADEILVDGGLNEMGLRHRRQCGRIADLLARCRADLDRSLSCHSTCRYRTIQSPGPAHIEAPVARSHAPNYPGPAVVQPERMFYSGSAAGRPRSGDQRGESVMARG